MTVELQERYLDEVAKLEKKKLSEEREIRESRRILVVLTLQMVDKTVQMEDILHMHPLDYIAITDEIDRCYDSGRELSDEDFQKA